MLVLMLLAFLAHGAGEKAEMWSRFRGPNGSGVAADRGYPVEFGPTKNLIWKRPVRPGKSSPVLTRERIFLTAEEAGKLFVLCLDRRSGQTIWERSVTRPRSEAQHPLNSAAAPTAVTDGENIFAFFRDFGLISYDRPGQERWRAPLGPFTSLFGVSSSPILAGSVVALLVDQMSESYIIGLDRETGRPRWKTPRGGFAWNYSTPITRRSPAGSEEIVVHGSTRMAAYDPETGRPQWSAEILGGSIIASPIHAGDWVFAITSPTEAMPSFDEWLQKRDRNGDGVLTPDEFGTDEYAIAFRGLGNFTGNRDGVVNRDKWNAFWRQWIGSPALLAVRLETEPDGKLTRCRQVWTHGRSLPRVASPLLYENALYIVANGGILTALDPGTGEVFKTGRLTGALDNYYASPVAADGKIYLTSESGKVAVVKAGPAWELLGVNDVEEDCYATPALSEGKVFLRTSKTLFCFGRQ